MNYKKIAIGSIMAGALITFASLTLFLTKTTTLDFALPIESNIFANYGALVGGVVGILFSLAGVLLLIQNINDQEKNFIKAEIESHFFGLIKIQRQNSRDIEVWRWTGKRVFINLLAELDICVEVVHGLRPNYPIDDSDTINIAYLAFFYGTVGPLSEKIMKLKLDAQYGGAISTNELLAAFKTKQEQLKEDDFGYLPFDGHQSQLGHYFRHLFQSVSYMNEMQLKDFGYREKYAHVKVLRAQLTTQEQILLFYNSLSDLGGAWERSPEINDVNHELITKYNLITNIPEGFVKYADPRKLYPNVTYEGDRKTQARINLESRYS